MMSHIKNKSKNLDINNYEFNRKEEDLFNFFSQYEVNIQNDEELRDNIIQKRGIGNRLSINSTSVSQECINISTSQLTSINIYLNGGKSNKSANFNKCSKTLVKSELNPKKESSPICFYYNGSDKYLAKSNKSIINLDYSQNFIRKDSFFNISNSDSDKTKTDNNSLPNKNLTNDNLNNNLIKKIPMPNLNSNLGNNIFDANKNNKKKSFNIEPVPFSNVNNINKLPNKNLNNNNISYNNINYNQQALNNNYRNFNNCQDNCVIDNIINKRKLANNSQGKILTNSFNSKLDLGNINSIIKEQIYNPFETNLNSQQKFAIYNGEQENLAKLQIIKKQLLKQIEIVNNKKMKAAKKHFDKRKDDWICPKCKNLNFAFRLICNRCKIPKPNFLIYNL